MYKVYLFGSRDLQTIPDAVIDFIKRAQQSYESAGIDYEFILGDGGAVDAGFNYALSSLGLAKKSKVYALDNVRNNKFDLPVKRFTTEFDSEKKCVNFKNENGDIIKTFGTVDSLDSAKGNIEYIEFRDRELCTDCSWAICYWSGDDKVTSKLINILTARGKQVYVFKTNI